MSHPAVDVGKDGRRERWEVIGEIRQIAGPVIKRSPNHEQGVETGGIGGDPRAFLTGANFIAGELAQLQSIGLGSRRTPSMAA